MMGAVKRGSDRQKIHEIIRKCSMEATAGMKEGRECDLMKRLSEEKEFGLTEEELKKLLDPALYIGRCPEQVTLYLDEIRHVTEDAAGSADAVEI